MAQQVVLVSALSLLVLILVSGVKSDVNQPVVQKTAQNITGQVRTYTNSYRIPTTTTQKHTTPTTRKTTPTTGKTTPTTRKTTPTTRKTTPTTRKATPTTRKTTPTTRKTTPTTRKTTATSRKTTPTTRKTTATSRRTTTTSSHSHSQTYYYYLDQCPYISQKHFYNSGDSIYVKAWSPSNPFHTASSSSCTLTISSYALNKLKYRFVSSGYIYDCSVSLDIYSGSSVYTGALKRSYSCYDSLSTSYQYVSSSTGYLTIKLTNYNTRNNFDFSIYVTGYDDSHSSTGLIVGLVVGSIAFCIVIAVVIALARRRHRMRYFRGDRLITTTTTTTANYNYPTGQAPYPGNNYGSTAATTTNYPPPAYPGVSPPPPPPAGAVTYPQK